MEVAMKTKDNSFFVANPLLGLPNEVATSTKIIAGKETDPCIEIYPLSELPTLPHHTLLHHSALIQKAITAALGMMEVLRLTNKDLEEEHDRMKSPITTRDNDLVCVIDQLFQAQEKSPTKAKRATKGRPLNNTLLHHSALIQKALTAALGMMEVLRLTNKDLEEEHDRMKSPVTTRDNDLVRVTDQLLQAKKNPRQRRKELQKVRPLNNNCRGRTRYGDVEDKFPNAFCKN